jgi:hypothetical protein
MIQRAATSRQKQTYAMRVQLGDEAFRSAMASTFWDLIPAEIH